jgi:DNA-binding MarR family transcriptional regulator
MADDTPAPEDALGFRALTSIRRIVRRVASHSRHLARETGLTVPQLLVVRAIDELTDEDVTVAAVADAVHLSRSTVSVVVERLVKAGLVNRDRSVVDRRRVRLSLTEAGRQKLSDTPGPLQDRFLARLHALPAAEQETLLSALEQVVDMMDADDLDAAPMLVPGVEVPGPGGA